MVFGAFLNPVTAAGGGAEVEPKPAEMSRTSPTVAAPSRLQPQNNAR